ncbi:octanoyltransferase [Anoxybacter fermentans]|uniref:Octanoyltransferase n=1 Tax=Anoxybacter fermentans TaxID=1323375 RepID=A0A3S9SX82_9FIRM|nr:biotin/lipoate A/B protein ligase family protein [Anoxybacter fermentans]AZR72901.1 octanoyltransferase [Anoxybacter fermentans]
MKWRLLNTGFNDPAFNMALDEADVILLSEGKIPPTIRFYGWLPASISIGYFQKMRDEIDVDACKALGIGIVRRLTGGRAVLHDDELTYSFIVPDTHPLFPPTVIESYKVISRGILRGLEKLNVFATMVSLEGKGRNALNPHNSSACFDAPSWYEIAVNGKKLVGSAQNRQRGVILQHGSILNTINVDKLFSVLKFNNEQIRQRMKKIFLDKATSIEQVLGYRIPYTKMVEAFTEGFQESLQIDLEPGELTDEEKELTEKLIREKYGNDEWNFRR